ncbi:MAG: hypothetical protein CMJ15_04690 [Pelagibacterium sp.]|nr:hypothetical protein [Pelagibacterium sp.]
MGQGADVGATLRGYRARFSIKQDALARALGVSQGQLSRWESGRERPGARNRDVIDALIHGRADPLLAGLIHYVRGARAPLALFDARLAIVAASPTLTGMGAPLARLAGCSIRISTPHWIHCKNALLPCRNRGRFLCSKSRFPMRLCRGPATVG